MKRKYQVGAILLSLNLITGCGVKNTLLNSKSGSTASTTDLSSHDVGTSVPAECNHFSLTGVSFFGNLAAYRNADNKVQEDLMRVQLQGVPDSFSSNLNTRIRFYRAKTRSSTSNEIDVDSYPLTFRVDMRSDAGIRTLRSGLDKINSDDISSIKKEFGIKATSTNDFFRQVEIVVSNVDYSWDFMKVAMYDKGVLFKEANVLMPLFAANPNDYATNHPDILNKMHPFWEDRSSSQTDQDYADQAKGYCF